MRRAKPKKQKQVTLRASDLNRLKREVTKDATDKACLILLAAMVDELHVDDEQLCRVMECTNRYASFVEDHLVQMEDIRKAIQKGTGIELRGWC